MNIQQIDKNFAVHTEITEPDIVWFDIKEQPFSIHGVFYDENEKAYVRLPQQIANIVSEGVGYLNKNTPYGKEKLAIRRMFLILSLM